MKFFPDTKFRTFKQEARREILKAVNRHTRNRTYRMKNINEAVHVARHHRLVKDKVLVQAGFRAS